MYKYFFFVFFWNNEKVPQKFQISLDKIHFFIYVETGLVFANKKPLYQNSLVSFSTKSCFFLLLKVLW